MAEGLAFRELDTSDGPRYAADIGTDSATTFRARLSEETRCFAVLSEGRIVHATWMTTFAAWTREVAGYLRPPPQDAYVYESFTRAEVRGRGVYPFALKAIAARLAGDGIKTVWVAAEASNAASLRAVSKAGFERRFSITYKRSLGRLEVGRPGPRQDHLQLTTPPAKRPRRHPFPKTSKKEALQGGVAEQGEP